MSSKASTSFAFASPTDAVMAMQELIRPVQVQTVHLDQAPGRILAESVYADRPSPACDVSAMDGYAVGTITPGDRLPVVGEIPAGQASSSLPINTAIRIFTGSPIPNGCEAVIPREQVQEYADAILLPDHLVIKPGQHIRRLGENGQSGQIIADPGTMIGPHVVAAMAACGVAQPRVYRPVRLAVIVTGDEVVDVTAPVESWQLRDSNGPTLMAMFARQPWINWRGVKHVVDDRACLQDAVATALSECDCLLLTGGVSMGDHDYVPQVLVNLGCLVVYHKLPIRPGKPILAAIGPSGQVVFGLPGNPVSVAITARRFALPALRRLAGAATSEPHVPLMKVVNPHALPLQNHWFRPVRVVTDGQAELIKTSGSGDIINTSRSDGFIYYPPGQTGPGPWQYYSWIT